MSILIKGMEMPTSCSDCKIRLSVGCCGNLPQNTRMPNCPLVSVPPHGDLIDRDALIKDGWHLHKGVKRMGGYSLLEMSLKNPSIVVIIPAEEGE